MFVPSQLVERAQAPRRSGLAPRRFCVLALVVLLALASCGGDDSAGDDSAAAGEAAATAPADGDAGGGEGAAGGSGGDAGETPGASETPGTGTGGGENARFNLIASSDNVECSYVPNGHLDGSDLLNVHFYFLIIGGNPSDVPLLSVTGESDTGLATSYNAGPHNQAVTTAQLALRPEDFGRGHAITLTVDAAGRVPETDESDNRITVRVSLPSPRPSSVVDPLACSAAGA